VTQATPALAADRQQGNRRVRCHLVGLSAEWSHEPFQRVQIRIATDTRVGAL